MRLRVEPASVLNGEITLPGDKSISHRAALFAALAEGESRIENFLLAGVTRRMLRLLSDLSIRWELQDSTLWVEGRGLRGFVSPAGVLDCGNSATTMRLLAGALAGGGCACVLDGSQGLRRRPMGRLVDPLRAMGAPIEAEDGEHAPIRLLDRLPHKSLQGMAHTTAVASAQVKSAILLAALSAGGDTWLQEPGPSRDHTERMLAGMGVGIERSVKKNSMCLHPPDRPLKPLRLWVPGDFSSAAFMIVAGLIVPESEILIRDVGLNPTRTGLLTAMKAMGANIAVRVKGQRNHEPIGDVLVRASSLRGTRVDGELVVRMIDEFPAFATAAAFAEGRTEVRGAAELRRKETDRISALVQEMRSIGVKIEACDDGFTIEGGQALRGGVVQGHGDHRLAMALAVAGLGASAAIEISDAEIIAESYPGFEAAIQELGAEVQRC